MNEFIELYAAQWPYDTVSRVDNHTFNVIDLDGNVSATIRVYRRKRKYGLRRVAVHVTSANGHVGMCPSIYI